MVFSSVFGGVSIATDNPDASGLFRDEDDRIWLNLVCARSCSGQVNVSGDTSWRRYSFLLWSHYLVSLYLKCKYTGHIQASMYLQSLHLTIHSILKCLNPILLQPVLSFHHIFGLPMHTYYMLTHLSCQHPFQTKAHITTGLHILLLYYVKAASCWQQQPVCTRMLTFYVVLIKMC